MNVIIETSLGTIHAELDEERAPVTVANFLAYVDDRHYDGTLFHRVIRDFMIQGGGFSTGMVQKPTRPPIRNEAANRLANDRGTLAMARTGVVDSATSQFFINHRDNAFLNHQDESLRGFGYCVFGKVVAGMDVVDRIASVATSGKHGPLQDAPLQPVEIKSVRRATPPAR